MKEDPTYNYHGGDRNSNVAHSRTNKPRDFMRLIKLLDDNPDGMTCDEAELALGMLHQTCSARFTDMKRYGWIECCGRRPTRTGSPADVWRLAPEPNNAG